MNFLAFRSFSAQKKAMSTLCRAFSYYTPNDGLVEPEWLQQRLGKVRVLDATLHLDPSRNAEQEFIQKRIPTAQFFNIDKIADTSVPLPHMLSTPEYFKQCVEKLGISTNDEIVVYDTHGLFSATRAFWMFRVFNPNVKVYVLNGGLVRWNAEGRKTESGACAAPAKGNFKTEYHPELVRNMKDILNMIDQFNAGKINRTVIDARPNGRFTGEVAEARPGLQKGHMPGSVNIPFNMVSNPEKNFMIRPKEELQKLFDDQKVDLKQKEPIIFSCGSGTTACVDYFAAYLLGRRDLASSAVYDGSWAEYGQIKLNNPVIDETKK